MFPSRITYHSFGDRMVEWYPDGKHIVFASRREIGSRGPNQFFKVSKEGGLPERLAIPYGELASFSPSGSHLAYITKITENYPFKRYRGGLSSDIIVFDLKKNTAENITNNRANDGKPAWVGDNIYFLSDQGKHMRLNIWAYNVKSKKTSQLTEFKKFDISFMSAGPQEIVFEVGGVMYLMDLTTQKYQPVQVNVLSDLSTEMPRSINVQKEIRDMTPSPDGKRIVFEARGELFNVPALEGYVLNMTGSSGSFDRHPAWSPDGKTIACWSDRSGEYEIYLHDAKGNKKPVQLTNRKKGYGYGLFWSPDSKKITFIDETNTIWVLDITSKELTNAGHTKWNVGHRGRDFYQIAWSPDSKWITFSKGLNNSHNAIFVYHVEQKRLHQISNGFYDDSGPVFSVDGKYLFYLTSRNFSATYSDMGDGTWVYPNSTEIAAVSLTKNVPSLLAPKNDDVESKEEKPNKDKPEAKEKKKDEKKKPEITVDIDTTDIEARLTILPVPAGNLSVLIPFDNKLVYLKQPNTGSGSRAATVNFYDIKERKEETIVSDVNELKATADGKSLLVNQKGKYGIIKPAPKQSIKKPIPTNGLVMKIIPRQEWRQIFMDTWRRHRDFFYDPNMQQVDWDEMRKRYGALIEDARTRWDVSFIQSNLAAELSAGHTYTFGGDREQVKQQSTGFLGIDWKRGNNSYQIKRIVQPAVWDTEVRSPFDQPGVKVKVGETILSVNRIPLDITKDPCAAFDGLSGETVLLKISSSGKTEDARDVVIQCLTEQQERTLRYLEWIENNRKTVERLSRGKLGYIYMSNTADRGQKELVRMYLRSAG